jgi:hypothetical protein
MEESDSDWLYRGYIQQPVNGLTLGLAGLPDLRAISLWGCAVDNDFFVNLGRSCKRLEVLEVCGHLEFVTDSAMTTILEELRYLKTLKLLGGAEFMTDNALMLIARVLGSNSDLNRVQLQRTRHMSWIGAEAVAESLLNSRCNFDLVDETINAEVVRVAEEQRLDFNQRFQFSVS